MITIEILGKVKGTKWCALPTKACHAAFFKISKFFIVCLQHHCKKPPALDGQGRGIRALMPE
jgi:hypothetical protein